MLNQILLLVFWIVMAVGIGAAADARGRHGFAWFMIAVMLSPVVGAILLALYPSLHVFPAMHIYEGVPFRKNGTHFDALIDGVIVRFFDQDTFMKVVNDRQRMHIASVATEARPAARASS